MADTLFIETTYLVYLEKTFFILYIKLNERYHLFTNILTIRTDWCCHGLSTYCRLRELWRCQKIYKSYDFLDRLSIYWLFICDKFDTQLAFSIWLNWRVASILTIKKRNMTFRKKNLRYLCRYAFWKWYTVPTKKY